MKKEIQYSYKVGIVLIYILLLIVSYTPLKATDTLYLNGSLTYDLPEYTSYYPSTTANSIQQFLDIAPTTAHFPLQEFKAQINKKQEGYWGKAIIKHPSSNTNKATNWIIQFSTYVTEVDVYTLQEGNLIHHQKTGGWIPMKERTRPSYNYFHPIAIHVPLGETRTIIYQLKDKRNSCLPTFYNTLWEEGNFSYQQNQLTFYNGLFLGLVFFFLGYSILMYAFIRERIYLFYGLYLLGIGLYFGYLSGSFTDFWYSYVFEDRPINFHYLKHTFYLIPVGYLLFATSFMRSKTKYPKWYQYAKWLALFALPVFLADVIILWQSNLYFYYSDIIVTSYSILAIALVTGLLLYGLWQKDESSYFLLGGFSFLAIGGLLHGLELFGWEVNGAWLLKMGFIFEILLFAIGLAYQRRQMKVERRQIKATLQQKKWKEEQQFKETQRLKELNTAKNRLYTNITHEFRTPLTVILGMADNLQNQDIEKDLIKKNGHHLLQLVNQLLTLSKLESKKELVNLQYGNLLLPLQYSMASFHSLAKEKNIQLTFYTEEEEIFMNFDELKIQHIINNLLSNAIKFTPEGGNIILHVQRTSFKKVSHLKIKVHDSGIGIPEEQIEQIFERFFQIDNSQTRSAEGTGIGLTLVKELLDLMNGEIQVSSKLGKGSSFTVWLPLDEASLSKVSKDVFAPQKELCISTQKTPEIDLSISNQFQDANQELPILLVIEDHEDIVFYIRSFLEKKYSIYTASDGAQGIEKAKELVPDIIISDIMMPKKDGYEVCNELKKDMATSHIPVILLTAKAAQENKVHGLKQGADAYLTKPFSKEELIVRLEQLIALRKVLQDKYATPVAHSDSPPSTDHIFLEKLQHFVKQKGYQIDFGVSNLIAFTGLSNMQLNRKLKALTRKTPSQYIRSIRLQFAKEFLKNPNLNISEVAYKVGFSDPSYFSRTFHQEFGYTPTDFRNRL